MGTVYQMNTTKKSVGSNKFQVVDLEFKPLVSPYIPLHAAQIIDYVP